MFTKSVICSTVKKKKLCTDKQLLNKHKSTKQQSAHSHKGFLVCFFLTFMLVILLIKTSFITIKLDKLASQFSWQKLWALLQVTMTVIEQLS